MSTYPSWRYHRNGKSQLIHNPDQEPQGADWANSPFPQPHSQPKLPECCQKLADKFDAAWAKRTAEDAAEIVRLKLLVGKAAKPAKAPKASA
jgi:hypothetical protein